MRGSLQAFRIAAAAFSLAVVASSAEAATTIGITKNANLAFGDLSSGSNPLGGIVTIMPNGSRLSSGGVTLLASTYGAANFTVSTSVGNTTYLITLPNSATLTSGGGFTMTVSNFTSNPSGSGTTGAAGGVGQNATQTLTVGARLNVGVSQKPGTYTGTFTVMVTLN